MKRYKINDIKDTHIGDTLFILEGAVTEFKILESIFTKRFGFKLVKKIRNTEGYILRKGDSSNRIFAFNYDKNQLHSMESKELDNLYSDLRSIYGFNPSNAAVYLIYDRDVECYEGHNIDIKESYLMKYTDCRDNSSGYEGLLIMSYPSIESYLTSCFIEDTYNIEVKLGKELKVKNAVDLKCHWGNIHRPKYNRLKDRLIIAVEEMDKALSHLGVDEYNIDVFCETNIKIFDAQEENYKIKGKFKLLSLLSIVFMQMGIIVEADELDLSKPRKSV